MRCDAPAVKQRRHLYVAQLEHERRGSAEGTTKMDDLGLMCGEEHRRHDVRAADLYGFDYVEIGEKQSDLTVYFVGKAPPKIELQNVRISGGRRISAIAVTGLRVVRQKDPTFDDYLEVTVDKSGDFSTYRL